MQKSCYRRRIAVGALVSALAATAGPARADCDANGNVAAGGSGVCWKIRGSDTLFDIMTEAIKQARLDGGGTSTLATSAKDLFYQGTGSGNAENAMRAGSATPAPNGSLSSQSIGPMSRNFRPSIIDANSTTFTARSATCLATSGTPSSCNGHAAWYPSTPNVVGLDAAAFIVKSGAPLGNVKFKKITDNANPNASPVDKADKNNAALPANINDSSAFNKDGSTTAQTSTVNYSNLFGIILSGVDGSGTLAACSDPRRVRALQDLAFNLGLGGSVNHIYRRDENSGTTDTFKDRIMVVNATSDTTLYPLTGGRFCNGASIGGINGAAVQQGLCSVSRAVCTTDANCPTGQKCWFNLNNPDYDPIRRPCTPDLPGLAPTSCTDMTTGLPCRPEDGNSNCTQGLIVALSDTDAAGSTVTDITTSIGYRIGQGDGSLIGYAGREAASSTFVTAALAINGIRPTDDNVRASTYLLARRLFIQNGFVNSTSVYDIPTNTGGGGGGNGGTDQLNKEQALWNGFLIDRSKMDPIVRTFNFIRCSYTSDGGDPDTEQNNLCSLNPPPATPGAFANYAPVGTLANPNGGTNAIRFDGRAATIVTTGTINTGTAAAPGGWSEGRVCTSASPCTCNTTTPCLTAATAYAGSAPCVTGTASGACVAPDFSANGGTSAKKGSGSPCTVGTECTSGFCADLFGQATPGEIHDLYCQ
jgi:hypothetical protein